MLLFIMKIPDKQELQQIAFSYSSDIDFKGFMNIHKKCTAKSNSFLANQKLIMTIDNKIRYEKLKK